MQAQLRTKWLAALRSGDYEQCQGQLHIKDDGYCCLGVFARCAGCSDEDIVDYLTFAVLPAPKSCPDFNFYDQFPEGAVEKCIHMNDDEEHDFPAIADWIEADVPEDTQ